MSSFVLNDQEIVTLTQALQYLNMAELAQICKLFAVPDDGKKGAVIERIVAFVKTGEILKKPVMPAVSKGKKGSEAKLEPDERILYGVYKNDARTRAFFKKLIGEHFHFTAFGVDWIHKRWMAGNPPTYAEYAAFWQTEYTVRKKQKAMPKEEWAYISFIQRFVEEYPEASKAVITDAWHKERQKQVEAVKKLLKL